MDTPTTDIAAIATSIAALVALVGGFATLFVVTFRTGQKLGEAVNRIDHLETTAEQTRDEIQDVKTEELSKDVEHLRTNIIPELRTTLRDLRKEVAEKEDDIEKLIDEVKRDMKEQEDDLEKRIEDLQVQVSEDLKEVNSDIKVIERDLKDLNEKQ